MSIERTTFSDPDWDQAPAPEPTTDDGYTEKNGLGALEALGDYLFDLRQAVRGADGCAARAARYLSETDDVQALVDTVALIRDERRKLAVAESFLERAAGQAAAVHSAKRTGELSDGRPYEILRGADRKAWDHQQWQGDVRRAIVGMVAGDGLVVVNPESGEETPLAQTVQVAVEQAQAVHSANAPKVTALKRLGLAPDDYCESIPGPYTVKIPTPTTPALEAPNGQDN